VHEILPSERLAASVSRVTRTMLGMTFRPHAAQASRPTPWRTVVLPIPGARPISVALSSDRDGCAALAGAMLGLAAHDIGAEMIEDFLRELLNMTAGQIKNELAPDQALGLPRVLDGDALFARGPVWNHHVLACASVVLIVSLARVI
jgi:hypothetical protein